MKPLATGALAGFLFASALIQGTSAVYLNGTTRYLGNCTEAVSISMIPTQWCTGRCSNRTGTVCASDWDFEKVIGDTMEAMPHVTISTFSGDTCTAADITSTTVYAADGSCYPIGLEYFQVNVGDGISTNIATIEFYRDSKCTYRYYRDDIVVTEALLTAATTTVVGCDGLLEATLYEISWATPMAAYTFFERNDCKRQMNYVSVERIQDTCSFDSCAAGSGVICTTSLKWESAISIAYGTTPYVTVSTYSDGSCAWSDLSNVLAFTADGKCRAILTFDKVDKYYKVTISSGKDTLSIQFFSNSGCTAPIANSDIPLTQNKLGCDRKSRTKYTYSGDLATEMKAITTFDDGDCDGTLGFISVFGDSCADVVCNSGTGEICTSNYNYESVIAANFGSTTTPYLMIATFSRAKCNWPQLVSANAFLADGNCHQYGAGMYYNVSAVPIGGVQEPKIYLFNDDKCTDADSPPSLDDVTRANLIAVNNGVTGCDGHSNGATLYKVSASWPKALSVVGLGAYTRPTTTGAPCVGGTPWRLTLTDASVAGGTVCGKTRTCLSKTYLSDCTTITDYKTYLKTAFASVPYLVRETYSATGCGTLSGVTAWAADGTCYVDGKNSFKVVATSSGVSIKSWKGDAQCTTSTTVTPGDEPVTASNLVANACIPSNTGGLFNKYYMGGNWVFASNAAYDDSKCAPTPSKLSLSLAPTCTAPTGDAACVSTTPMTPETAKTGYNAPGCPGMKANTADYFSVITKAFGMTTYVVQEMYTACIGGSLVGVTAYVADGVCHLSGDAASSNRVSYDPSATATAVAVKIETFMSQDCSTGAVTPVTVTTTALTARTCNTADFTKIYVGGLATQLTAVTMYADKACILPVQTVFTSTANTCKDVTACTASGTVFTKTTCTSAKSDYNEILTTVYGTTRHLVSDIYEAKDTNKCGTRRGIVAYVGDGACHTALDQTSFKVTLGSNNANFTTFSDKDCTKDLKALTIATKNLATATTAPCDGTNSIKWSIGGTESPTEAPTTAAPTPARTTAVSTGSGKSAAVSSFSVSIFGLLASIVGGLTVLLN